MQTERYISTQPYRFSTIQKKPASIDLIYYCCPTNQEPLPAKAYRTKKDLTPMTGTTGLPLRMQLSDDDFLTFDGPTGVVVAPDDSRHNFYRHLGLRPDVYRHKTIYWAMKHEARAGMERLFATRASLRPEIVDDASVVTPYNVNQISEVAFQKEVEAIYTNASRQTRAWYSMMDTGDRKNWVIRWMLWRVLRKAESCEIKAESSGSETDSSCALTTASTAADYPSVRTEAASPPLPSPTWMEPISPAQSPGDDENDTDIKSIVPINPITAQRKRPASADDIPSQQPAKDSSSNARRKRAASEDDTPDERPSKTIKQDPDAASSPSRQSDFWNRVMNT